MSRRIRAKQVMQVFCEGIQHKGDWDETDVANVLRKAVEGFNIEPNPDREFSTEKHYFIKGQLWVKDAIIRLADELDKMVEEQKLLED